MFLYRYRRTCTCICCISSSASMKLRDEFVVPLTLDPFHLLLFLSIGALK